MKISKAIEIKKHYQYVLPKESYPELIEADNLSIEALIRVSNLRINSGEDAERLLPGETKD